MQVKFINSAIDTAPRSSPLHGLPHVSDPSDGIVEVLIQCMEWNLTTRRRVIPESELPEVQQAAVDLLESLKRYLPDKCGEASAWNFEKAHNEYWPVLLLLLLMITLKIPCCIMPSISRPRRSGICKLPQ